MDCTEQCQGWRERARACTGPAVDPARGAYRPGRLPDHSHTFRRQLSHFLSPQEAAMTSILIKQSCQEGGILCIRSSSQSMPCWQPSLQVGDPVLELQLYSLPDCGIKSQVRKLSLYARPLHVYAHGDGKSPQAQELTSFDLHCACQSS